MRLAQHVEGLLKVSIIGQRAAVAGQQLLVAGIGDGGLFEHRDRLRALARRTQRLAILKRDDGILGVGAIALAIGVHVTPCIGGLVHLRLVAERPRDVGYIGGGGGLAADEADRQRSRRDESDRQSRQATLFERMPIHVLFGPEKWRLAKKSLQLNPKFGLTESTSGPYFGDPRASYRLRDELGPEFAADPPRQAALAGVTGREDQGEFGRRVEMLGDDFHTAVRNVCDHAVARQRAGPELDFREAPAQTTLASTTIGGQHIDLLPHPYRSIGTALCLQGKRWNRTIGIARNRSIDFDRILTIATPVPPAPVMLALTLRWRPNYPRWVSPWHRRVEE